MADIRIPCHVLQKIVADLAVDPAKDSWRFELFGGQVLEVKRMSGPHTIVNSGKNSDEDWGPPFNSLDFTYNDPGD